MHSPAGCELDEEFDERHCRPLSFTRRINPSAPEVPPPMPAGTTQNRLFTSAEMPSLGLHMPRFLSSAPFSRLGTRLRVGVAMGLVAIVSGCAVPPPRARPIAW